MLANQQLNGSHITASGLKLPSLELHHLKPLPFFAQTLISRIKSGFFTGSQDLIKCKNFDRMGCPSEAILAVTLFYPCFLPKSPLPETVLVACLCLPNGPITQLSLYLTRNPGMSMSAASRGCPVPVPVLPSRDKWDLSDGPFHGPSTSTRSNWTHCIKKVQ